MGNGPVGWASPHSTHRAEGYGRVTRVPGEWSAAGEQIDFAEPHEARRQMDRVMHDQRRPHDRPNRQPENRERMARLAACHGIDFEAVDDGAECLPEADRAALGFGFLV